ncbi:MAG: phage tail tape measure protein [Bacilli bacterium]|nr:phage tail tape measure protein [Bacilli bacterium]
MEDVSIASGLMANSGIKASQAGTSLRSIMSRLAAPPETAAKGMDALGFSLTDSSGKMKSFRVVMEELREKFKGLGEEEQAAMAKMIAGQEAMSGLLAIVNASPEDFEKLSSAIDESSGSAQEMADIMNDTSKGQITLLKSQIEGLAIQFGDIMAPTLKKVIDWLSKLMVWLSNLSPNTQKIIVIIGLVIAVLGPLLIMIGKMGTGISSLITLFTTIIPAIAGFITSLNPITIVIGLIVAAVVALGVIIYQNWESISAWTQEFVEKFKNFFIGIIEFIENVFSIDFSEKLGPIGNILNAVVANAKNIFESFKKIFSGITQFIKSVFTGDWKGAWEGVKKIFSGVFNMLYSIAVVPINLIIGALNYMVDAINLVIKGINKIKIPDWDIFGSLAGKGLNIPTLNKMTYLAKGGDLLRGTAIVGEAGPEMLYNNGKSTKVLPLTNRGGATPINVIDYDKLTNCFLKALAKCRMRFDKEGFVQFIKEILYEVI